MERGLTRANAGNGTTNHNDRTASMHCGDGRDSAREGSRSAACSGEGEENNKTGELKAFKSDRFLNDGDRSSAGSP